MHEKNLEVMLATITVITGENIHAVKWGEGKAYRESNGRDIFHTHLGFSLSSPSSMDIMPSLHSPSILTLPSLIWFGGLSFFFFFTVLYVLNLNGRNALLISLFFECSYNLKIYCLIPWLMLCRMRLNVTPPRSDSPQSFTTEDLDTPME